LPVFIIGFTLLLVMGWLSPESTTTRKAGGLDFPALMGAEKQKHVSALIVAVVAGCLPPGLKTTNHL
jgi:hypothetical protein